MSHDDARLDARVRQALRQLEVPDAAATDQAFDAIMAGGRVPGRRGSRWSRTGPGHPARRRWAPAAAAAAVAAVIAGVGVFLSLDREAADPAVPPSVAVVGEWQHRLRSATDPAWIGVWDMRLEPDGAMTLEGPPPDSTDGASYVLTGDRLRVDVFANSACLEQPGEYRVHRDGGLLTITVVDDPCDARVGVLTGTWQGP